MRAAAAGHKTNRWREPQPPTPNIAAQLLVLPLARPPAIQIDVVVSLKQPKLVDQAAYRTSRSQRDRSVFDSSELMGLHNHAAHNFVAVAISELTEPFVDSVALFVKMRFNVCFT